MFKSVCVALLLCALVSMSAQIAAAEVDPTRPFGHSVSSTATPGGKKMVLESIIHGDGIHTVVISGKVLKTFDYIGEYQLTAINDQSVILRSKTTRLKLTIFNPNIVKTRITK